MTTKELAIATSTVWVVLAAVLVMFMQAGFAFLEAGLTRMKNVGHIAAKNVLVLALASVVYYLVGFGIAFGDGGNALVGGSGFLPSSETLLAVGSAPFSWFGQIPAAAGIDPNHENGASPTVRSSSVEGKKPEPPTRPLPPSPNAMP